MTSYHDDDEPTLHNITNFPKPRRDAGDHRGRSPQRLMDANEIVVHREQTTLGPYGAMKPKDPVGVGVHPHGRDTLARGASSGVSGLKPCAAQFGQLLHCQ
jgi:hypothetical protein